MAAQLLANFSSLGGVLSASADAQSKLLPDEPAAIDQLQLVCTTMTQALKSRVCNRPVLSDERALIEYLTFTMAYADSERFRVLFLDARNCLLLDEIVATGSVRGAVVHPREIMRRAIEIGASALIVVHNHPSGDPTPSPADLETTRRLAGAADLMGLKLHDHLIVARSGYSSLKRRGVL